MTLKVNLQSHCFTNSDPTESMFYQLAPNYKVTSTRYCRAPPKRQRHCHNSTVYKPPPLPPFTLRPRLKREWRQNNEQLLALSSGFVNSFAALRMASVTSLGPLTMIVYRACWKITSARHFSRICSDKRLMTAMGLPSHPHVMTYRPFII